MGETTGEIKNHIRNTRQELAAQLNELVHRVRAVSDWRYHFRKNPGMFIATALGGGLMLSHILGRQKTRRSSKSILDPQ